MSYAKLIIVGKLAQEPTVRYTESGLGICSFSIPVKRTWKVNDEKASETTWYNLVAFGKMAETISKFFVKGSQIIVEGRLSPDKETGNPKMFDKSDGTKGTKYEVVIESFSFGDNPQTEKVVDKPEEEISF
jgi:single-strand DNA-binding protein